MNKIDDHQKMVNTLCHGLHRVKDIRDLLKREYKRLDRSCPGMVEIIGQSFYADEDHIFGAPNHEYIEAEIAWYMSLSKSVYDIPTEPIPKIWKDICSENGMINSNYGNLLLSEDNHNQFDSCIHHFKEDVYTRRAYAVYNRPSIHQDWTKEGMRDFICTNGVHYMVRNVGDKKYLVTHVSMRSNDVIFGYRNDYAWQRYAKNLVLEKLHEEVDSSIISGPIIWNASSLHVYPRHFKFLENYAKA